MATGAITRGATSAGQAIRLAVTERRRAQDITDAAALKRSQKLQDRATAQQAFENFLLGKINPQGASQPDIIDITPGVQNQQVAQAPQQQVPGQQVPGQQVLGQPQLPQQVAPQELEATTLGGEPGPLAPKNLRKIKTPTLIGDVAFTPNMIKNFAKMVSIDSSLAKPALDFLKFASDEQLAGRERQLESNLQIASALDKATNSKEIDFTIDTIVQQHGNKLPQKTISILQSIKNTQDFKTKKKIIATAQSLNTAGKDLVVEARAVSADARKEDIAAQGRGRDAMANLIVQAQGMKPEEGRQFLQQGVKDLNSTTPDINTAPLENILNHPQSFLRFSQLLAGTLQTLQTQEQKRAGITSTQSDFDAAQKDPEFKEFLKVSNAVRDPASVKEFKFLKSLKTQAEKDAFIGLKGQIAGGIEQQKILQRKITTAITELPKISAQAQDTVQLIDSIVKHPGFSAVVGLRRPTGVLPLRGTDAANFKVLIDQIKGKAFLEAYASLIGGGHISDAEGEQATKAIAALDTAQTEEAFKQNITILRNIAVRGLKRARLAAKGDFTESFERGLKLEIISPTGEKPDLSKMSDEEFLRERFGR